MKESPKEGFRITSYQLSLYFKKRADNISNLEVLRNAVKAHFKNAPLTLPLADLNGIPEDLPVIQFIEEQKVVTIGPGRINLHFKISNASEKSEIAEFKSIVVSLAEPILDDRGVRRVGFVACFFREDAGGNERLKGALSTGLLSLRAGRDASDISVKFGTQNAYQKIEFSEFISLDSGMIKKGDEEKHGLQLMCDFNTGFQSDVSDKVSKEWLNGFIVYAEGSYQLEEIGRLLYAGQQ